MSHLALYILAQILRHKFLNTFSDFYVNTLKGKYQSINHQPHLFTNMQNLHMTGYHQSQ